MILKTKTAEFSFDERGFILVTFFSNDEVFDADEAYEHIRAAETVGDNRTDLVLIDITKSYHVPTIEAKEILAEIQPKSAEALVVATLAHKIICNFYIKILKKCSATHPVEVFIQKEKAIEWLLSHPKKKQLP